jgi:type VI secretion system secreted protein VgrG
MVASKIELKIDNKDVPGPVIESLELHQVLGDHHRFTIELRRRSELVDVFGKSLEANLSAWLSKTINLKIWSADSSTGDSGEIRFIGVITEVNFTSKVDSLGNIFMAGYSPTIALDLNKMYHIWHDMSSSAIINQLISNEGLPNANVSASGGTSHPGLLAYDDTAYQIISYLSGFEGWWAYYDGLNFNVAGDLPDDKIELKANHLGSFTVEVDSTRLKDLSGSAYEYRQGSWFSSNSPKPNPSSISLGKAAADAGRLSSTRENILPPDNPISQRDLDQRLEIISRKSNACLLRARGTTDRFGLSPGKGLKISWSPRKRVTESRGEEGFDGLYLITRVEHKYKDGRYTCDFKAVARDLAYPYYKGNSFPGQLIERAWVTDVGDSGKNKLGSVKVRFDWKPEGSDGVESPFIRVCQLQAGVDGSKTHGTWLIPEVGDGVLVSIKGRHLENAAVIGSLYDGSHLPRKDMYTDNNMVKAICTKSGNEIIFNDTEDKEQLIMKAKGGACSIQMDSSKNSEKISLAVQKDGASLVMDGASGNEQISFASKGSACNISMSGAKRSIKIETTGSIEMKASEITLDAKTALNLKSQAQLKQKAGAMVDIDGGAMVKVKGGIIKLN